MLLYRLDPLAFRFYRGSPFSFSSIPLRCKWALRSFDLARRRGVARGEEPGFPPGARTRRGGRLGDPRMPAVKIIRRGGWIIVSNLVASLNCSTNFEIHFEFPIEFIDRIKSLFSHLGSIFDSLNHTLRWYDRVMIIYSIYILGFESLIQDGAAV